MDRAAMMRFDLAVTRFGTPMTPMFRFTAQQRGNSPQDVLRQMKGSHTSPKDRRETLWVVDRILPPQTVVHFFEFCDHRTLPSGKKSAQGSVGSKGSMINYLRAPPSEWAPAPFNSSDQTFVEKIMGRLGSMEDSSRLMTITTDLYAVKSRIWEGIMPLSARRWNELQLNAPKNFHLACQHLVAVIQVFEYLNQDKTKQSLRATYNLIWDHLKEFEDAINAKFALDSEPPISFTALWHEYISDFYSHISARSHRWVIGHVERLREIVLAEMSTYELSNAPTDPFSPLMDLADKIHDLALNTTGADVAIFLPMDGYKGNPLPAQDNIPLPDATQPYRMVPITFNPDARNRKADYEGRIKFLTREVIWLGQDGVARVPDEFLFDSVVISCCQALAQCQTRIELRGESQPPGQELWLTEANMRLTWPKEALSWGYVAYRMSHHHTDEEWEAFKAKFEADTSDWGQELQDVDGVKAISKIEWLDAADFSIADDDLVAARKHFEAANETRPNRFFVRHNIFLAADKASIDSYLHPEPRQSGFIVAVDAPYDEIQGQYRPEESPGYTGVLKVLGSLLWDDLGCIMQRQTQSLQDMWRSAMHRENQIYQGPLSRAAY